MNTVQTLLIPLAAIGLLAGAADAAADHGQAKIDKELDKALAGRIVGTPVECVSNSDLGGPQIYGKHTILFQNSPHRIWRTLPADNCPFLRPESILVTEVYGGQVCEHDRFQVKDPDGFEPISPFCTFGKFTPYDLPPKR